MKTIHDVYEAACADDALKAEMTAAIQNDAIIEFFAKQGVNTTPEEHDAYVKEVMTAELTDEQLEAIAGGWNWKETVLSIFTLGAGCGITAVLSACDKDWESQNGELLCRMD